LCYCIIEALIICGAEKKSCEKEKKEGKKSNKNINPMFFSSLLLLLNALVAQALWSDGIQGIDFMYNDLESFSTTDNTTLGCYNQCLQKAPSCVGWVLIPAGHCTGSSNATCYLKAALGNSTPNDCRISGFTPSVLQPQALETTPVGSVKPLGWLAAELNVVASGLTGYLPHFWADIMNSSFVGGKADTGLHERTPYWLNGLVPASYLTQDANLIALREQYLGYIIANQAPSGWIGIDDLQKDGNQYWGRMNIILALIQDYEASQNPKDITCIFNYLGEANRRLSTVPMDGWATVRAQDWIMGLWWLIDNFETLQGVPPSYNEAWLVMLADTIHSQMLSRNGDWKTYFDTPAFPEVPACTAGAPCNMLTHGVNIGQAIKSEAVWYRRSQDETDADSTFIRMRKLDRFHGIPSGMFQADEHLAGSVPSHGTETCAVVEAVVSYAQAGAILGEASLFERAERITYNALPASMTKDTWERVYLQASNEYNATSTNPFIWYTDGGDSPVYGLESNYGCCTANMHAGWPKFTQRAVGWSVSAKAISVNMWAPLSADTPLGTVIIATDYPFGDVAIVTVSPSSGLPTPVWLRIPSWADKATLSVNDGPAVLVGANGTFYPTSTTNSPTTFTLHFNPEIRL